MSTLNTHKYEYESVTNTYSSGKKGAHPVFGHVQGKHLQKEKKIKSSTTTKRKKKPRLVLLQTTPYNKIQTPPIANSN